MKRRLLPLLLAACCGPAFAANPYLCKPVPLFVNREAIAQAGKRLAAANADPDDQRLALADAQMRLASAILRQTGLADVGAGDTPKPADLMRNALDIWTQARPDAALARQLQALAVEMARAGQCEYALPILKTALSMADRATGFDSPPARAILEDSLRVALALNDTATARMAGPRWMALLRERTAPLAGSELDVTLDLITFDYRIEDYGNAEQLAKRTLALLAPDAPATAANTRRVQIDLMSIYYAQLRFAEAETLRMSLGFGKPPTETRPDPFGDFAGKRDGLIAQVRSGDLQGASSNARALLSGYQRQAEADRAAVAAAEQGLSQLQADASATKPAIAQAQRDVASARQRANTSAGFQATLQGYLGEILHAQGKLDDAALAYESALDAFRTLGTDNWDEVNAIRSDLAILERARGNTARAIALQRQVLQELLPLLGPNHPDVKKAQAELAVLDKKG